MNDFRSHLSDLRSCIARSLLALVVGCIASLVFAREIWLLLLTPLRHSGATMVNINPMEGLMADFQVSLVVGFVLAAPVVLYQFWRFLSPGLLRNERLLLLPAMLASSLLAVAGVAFSVLTVIPLTLHFLAQYGSQLAEQTWTQSGYASFIARMALAFAVVFQMPVAAFVLARIGLLPPGILVKQWRIAIFLVALLAALLSPPDIVSMGMLGIPMVILYAISIAVAALAAQTDAAARR